MNNNITADQINQARTFLNQAKDLFILLPKNPTLDQVASGLSLYLSLLKNGKRVSIACPDQMRVEFNRLVGVDKITTNLSSKEGKNLIVSFPYQEGSIEKVSYNIENDLFNLVIEPREGYPAITSDTIRYSFSGGNIDLIITVGVQNLSQLDSLFNNNQNLFSAKPVVNIDIKPQNSGFGKVNIIETNVASLSELLVFLFSNLGLPLDGDIATNLLSGITSGSQNFTSNITQASTFEAAAICLKNGARKSFQESTRTNLQFAQQFQPRQETNFSPNLKASAPVPQKQIEQKIKPKFDLQTNQKKSQEEAPPDWLKPKIYKGSTLL